MNTRAAYFIQVLETIASPLMTAVIGANPGSLEDEAKTLAALLAQSVQSGIAVGDLMDIGVMEDQSDSMRVALTALSAPLLAARFAKNGTAPDEAQMKSLSEALQASLSFSENFTPTPLNIQRLQDLAAKGQIVDLPQIHVQYLHALLPVIDAVQVYSFGQKPAKVMMDVTSRLVHEAEAIGKGFASDADELELKRASLGVLTTFATLYAQCHARETQNVLSMDENLRAAYPQNPGGGLSLENVWTRFDVSISLVQSLSETITGTGDDGTDTQAPLPSVEPAAAEAIETAPVSEPPTTPAPEAPPTDNGGAANPMSMFSKKPTDDAGEATPPTEQPAPEVVPEIPAEPAVPPPAPDTPETPPAPAPEEPPAEPKEGGGGGPMSFFKTPPPEDE